MARTKDFDEDEVLKKAIQVFWYKGYNGTSMQDLVDGLGISRSSLYDTYTDKHTLFVKALERYQDAGAGKMQEIIDTSGSAKKAIEKLLRLVIDQMLDDKQQKGCFIVNAEVEVAPHDTEVNNLVCRNDEQMENVFYQVIQKGKNDGEITNQQDATALAKFILYTIKGMQVTARSTTDKAFFEDMITLTVSVLN